MGKKEEKRTSFSVIKRGEKNTKWGGGIGKMCHLLLENGAKVSSDRDKGEGIWVSWEGQREDMR